MRRRRHNNQMKEEAAFDALRCFLTREVSVVGRLPINMTKMPAGKDQSTTAATKVEVEAVS